MAKPFIKYFITLNFEIEFRSIEVQSNQLNLNISWQGGGCVNVDLTRLYWRKSISGSLANNISLYNNSNELNVDPNFKKSKNMKGKGFWGDSTFKFLESISFQSEDEIDIVIMMTCDKSWGNLVIQTPLISPQSHMSRSRTDENFNFSHNEFQINSDKYVLSYLKNVKVENQSNSSQNPIDFYSIFLQSKFMPSNYEKMEKSIQTFEENNYMLFKYNELIQFDYLKRNFNFNGSITMTLNLEDVLASNLTSFIFEYGDIGDYNFSNLGKNINLNLNTQYSYFNDSFQFPLFFVGNGLASFSNPINLKKDQAVSQLSSFIDLIGRSIFLRSFSVNNYINIENISFYSSYITFSQSYQCENNAVACLGINLLENGICSLFIKKSLIEIKPNFIVKIIILKPTNALEKNIQIELIANLKYLREQYGEFSLINVKNGENEMNFSINSNTESNFYASNTAIFPLYYEKALGNKFSLKLFSKDQIISLGLCDIVYLNPAFDANRYTSQLNHKFPFIKNDDSNELIFQLSLGIGVSFFLLIIIGIST